MSQETKNAFTVIVFVVIVLATAIYLCGAYSDPCTRPYPKAQDIIDCQKLQPTAVK